MVAVGRQTELICMYLHVARVQGGLGASELKFFQRGLKTKAVKHLNLCSLLICCRSNLLARSLKVILGQIPTAVALSGCGAAM